MFTSSDIMKFASMAHGGIGNAPMNPFSGIHCNAVFQLRFSLVFCIAFQFPEKKFHFLIGLNKGKKSPLCKNLINICMLICVYRSLFKTFYQDCYILICVVILLPRNTSTGFRKGTNITNNADNPINISIIVKSFKDGTILANVSVEYYLKLGRKGNFTSSG